MKKILILLLCYTGTALAQQIPDYGFDKIRIAEGDKTVQAELKPVNTDPEQTPERFYYWYSGNSIHSTQGGFSGRLLNGRYAEYYLNKNLRQQGAFKKGLKDGTWRSWNDSGLLLESYTWVKGVKSGKFSLFDDHGERKQSGVYHQNLLEGPVNNYNGNEPVNVVTYHHGKIVTGRPETFWDKINLFKKKNKLQVVKTSPAKTH
jgi:antitoxin component YwqK of YwqJK toxin-antitoxin module